MTEAYIQGLEILTTNPGTIIIIAAAIFTLIKAYQDHKENQQND